MDASQQKIKDQLKSIRLVYYAMTASVILLSGVVYFLISSGGLGQPDYSFAIQLQTAAIIIVPASLLAGYFAFRSGLRKIDGKLPLAEKLQRYFVLLVVRGSVFEAGFLVCFAATILTRELLFLSAAPIILFMFLLLRPNAESMASDMNLSPSERNMLEA